MRSFISSLYVAFSFVCAVKLAEALFSNDPAPSVFWFAALALNIWNVRYFTSVEK